MRNHPSSVLHVSRVHSEDMLAREEKKEPKKGHIKHVRLLLPEGGLCERTQTSSSGNSLEILICYMCFESGSINEERLCVSSADLHLESLNTFGQNQPGPFYEQLISLDKTPFVCFFTSHCPHKNRRRRNRFPFQPGLRDFCDPPLNSSATV